MSPTTMTMQDTTSGMLWDQLHGWYQQQGSFLFVCFHTSCNVKWLYWLHQLEKKPVALLRVTCMLGTLELNSNSQALDLG